MVTVRILSALFILGALSGCGGIDFDSQTFPQNEPVPQGAKLLAQGTIQSTASGTTLTGAAQIYQSTSNGQITLRLAGLNASSQGLIYVFVETDNSQSFYVSNLRFTSGNQNYATGQPGQGRTFSRVVFRALPNTTEPELGSATLLKVN